MQDNQWLSLPDGLWQLILGDTLGETRLNAIRSCKFFGNQRFDNEKIWGERLALEFPEIVPNKDPKKWKAQYVSSLRFSCINTPLNRTFITNNNQRVYEFLECEDVQTFLDEQPLVRYTTLSGLRHLLTPEIVKKITPSINKMVKDVPEVISKANMVTLILQLNLIPAAFIYFDKNKEFSRQPIRIRNDFTDDFSLDLFPEDVNNECPLGYAVMLLRPFLVQFLIDYIKEDSINPIHLDPDLIIKMIAHPELPENHLSINVIDLLLENGWDMNYCIGSGFTALTAAISTQKYHTALYLLDHGAVFDHTSEMGNAEMLALKNERLCLLRNCKPKNPLIEKLIPRLEQELDLTTSLENASSLTQ